MNLLISNLKLYINVIDSTFFACILLITSSNFIVSNIAKLDSTYKHLKEVTVHAHVQLILIAIYMFIKTNFINLGNIFEMIINALIGLNGITLFFTSVLFIIYSSTYKEVPKKTKKILLSPFIITTIFLVITIPLMILSNIDNEKAIILLVHILPLINSLFYALYLTAFLINNKKILGSASKTLIIILILLPITVKILEMIFSINAIFWPTYVFCIVLIFIYLKTIKPMSDPVTGLLNTYALNAHMEDLENENYFFALLTLDNLKEISEKYGMNEKYICLNNFAKILNKYVNKKYTCYALGSNEILIHFENAISKDIDEVLIILENQIKNYSMERNSDYTLTFSSKYEKYDKERFENYLELLKYLYYSTYNEILKTNK